MSRFQHYRATIEAQLNQHSHRRRRTHKSKSVSTREEVVLHRILKFAALVFVILFAAYMTMIASRR
jgi:hypothetical protein